MKAAGGRGERRRTPYNTPMRIFLYGISALSWWLSAPATPGEGNRVGQNALRNCKPDAATIQYLAHCCPQIPRPYHVTVSARMKRCPDEVAPHRSQFKLVGRPFCRVASGIYAPCPELCFVQVANNLDLHELVKVGNALCGTFFIDPKARNGLGKRRPLTSVRRIGAFIGRNPGILGAKPARRALGLMVDGAASPPEVFLAMALGLPYRFGGYQLPGIAANRRIKPSSKARAIAHRNTLVPDILCESSRLDIEYDSNTEHASAAQLTRDAQKRLALEADGYKVITVTARQIGSQGEMRKIAEQSRRRMGTRLRPQSAAFRQQQRALFRTGWSLSRYHRREWLEGAPEPVAPASPCPTPADALTAPGRALRCPAVPKRWPLSDAGTFSGLESTTLEPNSPEIEGSASPGITPRGNTPEM